jgi:hypothetical protein
MTPHLRLVADDYTAERREAVAASRAILNSYLPHKVQSIRLACHTMIRLGDETDREDARHMLAAINYRPPYSLNVKTARDVMIGAAAMVWSVWLFLAVVMV